MTTSKRTHQILSRQGHVLYEYELPDSVPDKMATNYALEEAARKAADLAGADLAGACLAGANLAGVNLAGAELLGADMRRADLADANLTGAHLHGTDLTGVNLVNANLAGANLIGAWLAGASLANAYLVGADLSVADMRGANLGEPNMGDGVTHPANLSGVELSHASLPGVRAVNCAHLVGAKLRGLKLVGKSPLLLLIDFIDPYSSGPVLSAWQTEAGLRIQTEHFFGTREEFCAAVARPNGLLDREEYRAALALIDQCAEPRKSETRQAVRAVWTQKRAAANDALMHLNPATASRRTHQILSRSGNVLYECELPDEVPDKAAIRHALEQAVREGISLYEANLAGADLADADLAGTKLGLANLIDADLSKANLGNANLTDANLSSTNLSNAVLAKANLNGANLRGADLSDANLTAVDLSGAELDGANLSNANLTGATLSRSGLNLAGSRPLLTISPIGSEPRTLSVWLTQAGLRIQTDGFFGTREEFCAAVAHGDDPHAQEYRAALALIDKHAELWLPKAQPGVEANPAQKPDASDGA